MKVVSHETIRGKLEWDFLFHLMKQMKEHFIIIHFIEKRIPSISP